MKLKFTKAFLPAALLVAATLAGCATDQATQHRQHHPESSASPAATQGHMGMKEGQMDKGMMMMMSDAEMKSMCDMHMKTMSGKTPEERKALMAEHMKSMSPEMKQHYMEMMQMMQEHMGTHMPRK